MTASSTNRRAWGVASVEETLACHGRGSLASLQASELSFLIDHTLLKAEADAEAIDKLVYEAREHGFASVCVHPYWVPRVAKGLEGSVVRTCTVVGFPLGANQTASKILEAQLALQEGADELDMVMNIGAFKSGYTSEVGQDIRSLARLCEEGSRILKVIIESGLLNPDEIQLASQICHEEGAHFVKTSTGFASSGATVEAVRLMRKSVGSALGIKASGGILSPETALAMVAAGATRIGSSKSLQLIGRA